MKKMLLLVAALTAFCNPSKAQEFESATEAVKNMGVGWNLGNTLDANNQEVTTNIDSEGYWGQQGLKSENCWGQPTTTPELFLMMKDAGFGAIRVPVTWYNHMDKDGNVDKDWMKRVHEVVDYVIDAGLYCIINVHHDTGADSDNNHHWIHASMDNYNTNKARFENLWKQIATEFQDYDEHLLFESYNEMLDKYSSWCFATFNTNNRYIAADAEDAYKAINSYAQSFVNVVRETGGKNLYRNLVVNTYAACCGSGNWNSHLLDPLKEMAMPSEPTTVTSEKRHIAFEVHSYPNIENLTKAKSELDTMISDLEAHLVAKGGPVIIGEWGTSNVDAGAGATDYDVRRDNMLQFIKYFVEKAKANNIATFYWMGLTDGYYRSIPAFNQADLAEAITKAYHGDSFQGIYPTPSTSAVDYVISYTGDWQEVNLYAGKAISLSDYTGIRVVMADDSYVSKLQVKIYGGTGGKESAQKLTGANTVITFDPKTTGSNTERITLQTLIGAQTATLCDAYLIKSDGTEEKTEISVFWGCTINTVPRTTSISAATKDFDNDKESPIYNLSGQRVANPKKGVYIKNGKKIVIR